MLESTYDMLRLTRPFKGWRLPPGDEVVFHVSAETTPQGLHWYDDTGHNIRLSARKHKYLHSAIMTLAHEMCHIRQRIVGDRSDHGAVFARMADQVCKHHGFDRGQF